MDANALQAVGFEGKNGQPIAFSDSSLKWVVLIGIGLVEDLDAYRLRDAGARLCQIHTETRAADAGPRRHG